jgi:hypothetical protein
LGQAIAKAIGESRMKICIFTETYYPVMGGGETQAQSAG